jgi:hypothetical protein
MPVERYGGLREREVKLGGAVIDQIARGSSRATGRGVVAFERAPDESKLAFRFRHGQVQFTGSCLEELRTNMMGLKRPTVGLHCHCEQDGRMLAELALSDYAGRAELHPAQGTFEVSALHQTASGKQKKDILGYWFRSEAAEGAVDLLGDGRVFVPAALSAEQKSRLLCLYGALLLYKPSETM